LQDERQAADARFNKQTSELLSLQDNNDDMEAEILLHSEENLILLQEKIAAKTKRDNLRRKHNCVSASFTPQQQLNNPNINHFREDKNDTLREKFVHVFLKNLAFNSLGNNRKCKIVAHVAWEEEFLHAGAK
jgi:hypothetical protein